MNLYVGILCTFSQLKYGISKTGKSIYKCQPLDTSLGPIRIVYGGKQKGKIVIVFKMDPEKFKEEMPLGELYHVIGLANKENLVSTFLYHFNVVRKNFKECEPNESMESKISRKDFTKLSIFSIDPKGCQDIDDAFSFQRSNNQVIVGVHIAQPIYWLTKEAILERVEHAFSSLYIDKSAPIPLWSPEIQEKSSLLKDVKRPAYSIFFSYLHDECISIETFPSFIINSCPTHYDDTDNLQVKEFLQWTRQLLKKEIDTHELVSHWMMETNQYIGSNYCVPYRVQTLSQTNKNLDLDPEIKEIFQHYTMEKAFYSLDQNYHASLDRKKYTHFTSPIRRILDCLIHWQITYGESLVFNLEKINQKDQATKKFHRAIELCHKIENIQPGQIMGYLYEKISRGTWRVYFPELGFLKVKVIDQRLEHLIDPEKEKNFQIGIPCQFSLNKKDGFLPLEKIIITPLFKICHNDSKSCISNLENKTTA